MSTLSASSQQANKTALSAALAENPESVPNGSDVELGEVQEVDMQAQAEDIRTVFSHPNNFNVKVRQGNSNHPAPLFISPPVAPALLILDPLV